MVFTVIASLELRDEKDADAFGAKLLEFAEGYKKDEGTIDWLVHQDKKDPKKFMLVERYESSKSLKAHTANPLFKQFGEYTAKLTSRPTQIVGMYNELPKL